MAQNTGIVQLTGRVGNLVFRRGGIVSAAPSASARPASVTQSANRTEFRTAVRAGKLLRDGLGRLKGRTNYRSITARASARMREIIKLDTSSAYGERRVTNGNAHELAGFQFNQDVMLPAILKAATIDTNPTGIPGKVVHVTVPELLATRDLRPPQGATHFDLFADIVYLDFENTAAGSYGASYQGTFSDPDPRAIGTTWQNLTISGTFTQPPAPGVVLVVAFGIEWLQKVNGKFHRLYHSGKKITPYDIIYAQQL